MFAGAVALSGIFFSSLAPSKEQEIPNALAPRALRLVDSAGRAIEGNCRDAHWNARGNGVFFTLETNGTRNLWRAYPNPQDLGRFPAWIASPLTRLNAPQGAARPVPLPGEGELLCLRQLDAKTTQLALFDVASASFTPLVTTTDALDDPSPSPDGSTVAFTGTRGGQPALLIYRRAVGGTPHVLAERARRPVWLDADTLLYESLNPQAPGLYRVNLAPGAVPELLMVGGGEAGALPGGVGTIFSARTRTSEPTRLYLLARDGSGLRVLKGTDGARRPVPSRQGTVVYDAPLEDGGPRALWVLRLQPEGVPDPVASSVPRLAARPNVLPIAPSRRSSPSRPIPTSTPPAAPAASSAGSPVFPPVASASFVPPLPPLREPNSFVPSEVPVEALAPLKSSAQPFDPLVPSRSSLAPGFGSSIFSAPLPEGIASSGENFLEARDETGGALRPVASAKATPQSPHPFGQLLGVRRAVLSSSRLDSSSRNAVETLAVIGTVSGADVRATLEAGAGTAPTRWTPVPLTVVPVSQAPFAFWTPPAGARGPWTLRLSVTNRRGAAQSLLQVALPLPRLAQASDPVSRLPLPPPAPPRVPTPSPTPASASSRAPRPVPFAPLPPASLQTPTQTPIAPKPPAPFRTPLAVPTPRPDRAPVSQPRVAPLPSALAPPPATFAGTFNISGTLATMAPGQKTRVTFWGLNRGDTVWQSGARGAGRVRLVARWVDFSTGTRRKWNVVWLKAPVAPSARSHWEFDLEAPTRPGKYKLIYGLVRWPDGDDFVPPPYNAPQAAWAGEFAAIAFAIDVVPRSAP